MTGKTVKLTQLKTVFNPLARTLLETDDIARAGREEIEEVIFQSLASAERREILGVIRSRERGATYSEVLGELGPTTGNLNYHLKQLEGLIEKDVERRY